MELMLGKKWYNFKGCFKNQEKGKIYCNVQDLAVHNEFLWIKIFVAIPYRYLLQIGGFLVKYYGLRKHRWLIAQLEERKTSISDEYTKARIDH